MNEEGIDTLALPPFNFWAMPTDENDDLKFWETTNHGHLPPPTKEQFAEMQADVSAQRVYDAHSEVFFAGIPRTFAGRKSIPQDYTNTADINNFVLGIQHSDYAKKNWPKFAAGKPVLYYEGKEGGPLDSVFGIHERDDDPTYLSFGATASTNNVSLTVALSPVGGYEKSTVLHELAHAINGYEGIMRDHGEDFRGIYLKLIRQYMPEKARALADAFRSRGLKWTR